MATQTNAAMLRSLTASTLAAYGTLAGSHVEQERQLPLAPTELPHLNVFVDESGEARYQGGPQFTITAKLQIKATSQRAVLSDALGDLDTLVWQIKEALFGNPAWIIAANQVLSFNVTNVIKSDASLHQAEALVTFNCQWLETITIPPPGPGGSGTAGAIASENVTISFGGTATPVVSGGFNFS